MFDLNPNPTFKATVDISQPGGGTRPLAVVFRHMTRKQFEAWQQDDKQKDVPMAMDLVESVPDKPEDQTLQAFFEELFDKFPASAMDVYFTYRRELFGSRVKN